MFHSIYINSLTLNKQPPKPIQLSQERMLQELLGGSGSGGGGGLFGGDSKFSFHGVVLEGLPSVSVSPSASSSSGATAANTTATQPTENLRCPRCDSPNTKFCYYNNYNLTQPRHFCKACRRYWTKGGALRNIPIGGGCRKNKTTIVSTTSTPAKSTAGKAKTIVASTEVVRANVRSTGFDHQEQSTNPILWGSPQSSQLLALLRATPHSSPNPNPNPNHNLNYSSISNLANIKDEGYTTQTHGLDPPAQVPFGLYNSLFGNKPQQQQNQHHYHQQQNLPHSTDAQNTGIQDLYQRLRSSINYYPDQSSATVLSNVTTSMQMTSSSTMTEVAAPVVGGDFSSWNSPFSWSDLPSTAGAFP